MSKRVRTTFCCKYRAVYPKVQAKAAELVRSLTVLSKGDEAVDLAYALMCETMDVLGLAGFNKAYHNLENLSHGKPAKILDVRAQSICSL